MTFEQLLVKYIYQHKQVSLQGFGTVSLSSNIPDIELVNKNRQIPIEGAAFVPNIKGHTDENFVLFFAQQRGKIKPLAASDIESHLQLAKQLMNIGKPYEIEGLGIFAMQKDGSVVLQPGHYAVPFADNAGQPARLKERTEQQEKTEAEASGSGLGVAARNTLIAVAVILALGVAGWFVWSKMVNDKAPETNTSSVVADTTQTVTALKDSLVVQAPLTDGIASWRAYFRTFTGKQRVPALKQLYENYDSVNIETPDSINFRMYIVVKGKIADTTLIVDSLTKVFLRPVTLEKQNP
ncbi:hypothetical protein BH10BAC3_BH10BAC3_29650 [soil metagenome]